MLPTKGNCLIISLSVIWSIGISKISEVKSMLGSDNESKNDGISSLEFFLLISFKMYHLIIIKLYQHCAEVENQAKDMYDTLMEQMKISEGVTEELKENNPWEWIQRMENIQQRASEIVCKELIYS